MMQSEAENFLDFVELIEAQDLLSHNGIEEALHFLDGIDGVVREKFFIFGYEEIAQKINKTCSFDKIFRFIKNNSSELMVDHNSRYYFLQSLIDNHDIKDEQRSNLIQASPTRYQPFLRKRFG